MRPAFELLLALSENNVLGTGPNGEPPTPPIGFGLTDDELQKVRAMAATAAIVMHYGGNDWSQAQLAGLRAEFAEMGIDVVAVTDAGFDPEQQVADIEAVLARKPDVIVSIPTDPVATAPAYKQAVAQGVKLVFMDNVPKGLDRRGTVGVVTTTPTSSSRASVSTPSSRRSSRATPRSRSSPSGASTARTSPPTRTASRPRCCNGIPVSTGSGRSGTSRRKA